MLNVEKSRIDKVYSNQSLIPIIQALGCGVGEDCDLEKLRYGKVIIMADADVDGSHIRVLLLTFFYRYMRPLIEQGHVYLAQPPLYKIKKGKSQERYAFSDAERDQIIAEMGGNTEAERYKGKSEHYAFSDAERDQIIADLGGNIEAERYKGLGEMDPEQLWETTMDPERRTLLKVTVGEALLADETFSLLMGDEVEPRRNFIEQNAKFVENLDV